MLPFVKGFIADHVRLRDKAAILTRAADAIGRDSPGGLLALVNEALDFLRTELIPHDRREELTVQPVLCEQLGATAASQIITRDHQELEYLTDELSLLQPLLEARQLTNVEQSRLRSVLSALNILIDRHFDNEEERAYPLLSAS